MALMLLFVLNQQTVIFRDCRGQQVLFFNQASAERTADQTAGNQTKGGSCSTDRGVSLNIKVFSDRTECSGCTMTADHWDGAGTHTNQRI